jgi:sec-independent protein translocase protein TatA
MFGNIGLPELILIFALALLVLGPKKLPEAGRVIGKAIREFQRAKDDIKDKLEKGINADEISDIGRESGEDDKEND